ncbi:hypothetical protein ABZP36_023807 [Zizania latifolia]
MFSLDDFEGPAATSALSFSSIISSTRAADDNQDTHNPNGVGKKGKKPTKVLSCPLPVAAGTEGRAGKLRDLEMKLKAHTQPSLTKSKEMIKAETESGEVGPVVTKIVSTLSRLGLEHLLRSLSSDAYLTVSFLDDESVEDGGNLFYRSLMKFSKKAIKVVQSAEPVLA